MSRTVLVLTGGIGSGKSTVAGILAVRGAEIIEADRLGHDVLAPDGAAHAAVAARWPEVMRDGEVDRRALGRIVFGDPAQLAELEAFTHPAIRDLLVARLTASEADVVVVEIPIRAEWLDPTWPLLVVDVDDGIRRARLRDRGMDDDEIDARIAAQPSREEWRASATWVLENDGDLAHLAGEVGRVWANVSRG
ncbi:MAG: dephospho-CoA kinase [Acidimicrobiia bacterium]|nr:dephospho-CoA kinase [Acidimicrobiia bacterium]